MQCWPWAFFSDLRSLSRGTLYTSQARFLLPRKFRHLYVTLLRLRVGLESCIIAQREWLVLEKHIVTTDEPHAAT